MLAGFRTRTDLLVEQFDDALIVVDVQGGQVHELNSTAAWLWCRLDKDDSAKALAKSLCYCYDVSMEVAEADVNAILEQWLELGLLFKEQVT